MIKLLVTKSTPKSVQTALINGLSRSVRQLNSEDYNYASILSSISLFESYAKLAATYLGMNVEVKFTIGHSSKGRVNLLNTTVPKVNIKDINAAFRSNYNILVNFVAQVEAIYLNAFKDYERLINIYNLEVSEYSDSVNEWIDNVNELTDALSNAGVTNEEIQEVINEAREETEAQIEENIRDAEDLAQEVWDTNKGYETSSQIQEDAIKAAEEYAEAKAHEAEAEAGVKAAQEEADRAELILSQEEAYHSRAQEQLNQAEEAYQAATQAADQARDGLYAAETVNNGLQDVSYAVDPNTKVGDIPEGVYPGEDGAVTSVTHHDGYTTISTVDPEDGVVTTRTYTDEDQTLQQALDKADEDFHTALQASAEAEAKANQAEQDLKTAQDNEKVAAETLADAKADYEQAQAKVDAAQNAYDDASIPYATDDELEHGWDGSNNTEDDYGEDDWGDWSDIIGEGIEDSGDEDDSEDTED